MFKMTGHTSIVISSDGSQITEDEILEEIIMEKNVLMILRCGEIWTSADQPKVDDLKVINMANVVKEPIAESEQLFQFILDGDVLTPEFIDNLAGHIDSPGPSQAVSPVNRFCSLSWENVPGDILQHLINKELLSTQQMSRFVQTCIDRVRETCKYTKKKEFEIMAKEIVDKYPRTFKDYDEDGNVIGDGHLRLLMKLINRNSYLNRTFKEQFTEPKIKKITTCSKIIMQKSSGTKNWQPNLVTSVDYSDLKATLLKLSFDPVIDRVTSMAIYKESFASQRLAINTNCGVAKFFEEWPINRKFDFIICHFVMLTDMHETDLVLLFKTKLKKLNDFFEATAKKPNATQTTSALMETHVIFKLATYFKESAAKLVVEYPVRKYILTFIILSYNCLCLVLHIKGVF